MLKVFLHSAPMGRLDPNNLIGRLDIAYEELDIYADYKAALVMAGVGELPPVTLHKYPRWTASIWDLVARCICMCLYHEEFLPPIDYKRSGAFADQLTAGIEHWPDGFSTGRSTVGLARIKMKCKRRHYEAMFEDDILGATAGAEFVHTPEVLNPWDLLARAYAWTKHGSQMLPSRPLLSMPPKVEIEGQTLIPLNQLKEPVQTGLMRWLIDKNLDFVKLHGHEGAFVTDDTFVKFLRRAI